MKISTKGQYAIEALLYLAMKPEGQIVNIVEVANEIQVTPRYMEQIFFKLRKANLLSTVRGVKGGYQLTHLPKDISIKTIIEATEGEIVPVPCVYDQSQCSSTMQEKCSTRTMWQGMVGCIHNKLESIKLEDLVIRYQKLGEAR